MNSRAFLEFLEISNFSRNFCVFFFFQKSIFNDEKILKNIVEKIDTLPKNEIKEFLQRYIQKAYYYDAYPKLHSKKKLKDGSEAFYYMFPVPNDAIKYGKIDPK